MHLVTKTLRMCTPEKNLKNIKSVFAFEGIVIINALLLSKRLMLNSGLLSCKLLCTFGAQILIMKHLSNKTLAISGLALMLSLLACNRFDENEGTVFRYNEAAGITSLDPVYARSQSNIWVINQLYNGLLQLDTVLHLQPSLAHSFDVLEEGTLYRLFLRQDAFYHDADCFPGSKGRKVVAGDFVYSFNRLIDPSLNSPGLWVMNPVARRADGSLDMKAVNDSVLEIRLKEVFPPFAGLLCMQYCSVVPREAVEAYGRDFRMKPVGTGPFVFRYWKEGVKLVMLRNPAYFEFEHNERLPYLDAISVSFIVDKQTAFLEFIKGKLDFLSGIDASYKDDLLTKSGKLHPRYEGRIKKLSAPYLNTEYLGILYDRNNELMADNPLSQKLIRQAINYGFDRERMIRYLRNNIGIPAHGGMVPIGMPGFEENAGGYTYNPQKAKELLALAGFPNGEGLPIITLSTNAAYLDLCQFIQHELEKIGIRIKIDVMPPATLREFMAKAGVSFFRGSWIADYPDAENYLALFYAPNKAPSGPNYTHFQMPAYDRLFEQAGKEVNDSLRILMYKQLNEMIIEEAPVVVLFYDQVLRFTQNNIQGLGINPLNLLDLKRVKKQ